MTTTITYKAAQLERTTQDGAVFQVHWTVEANDGTYSASGYSSTGLEPPDPETMIPYAELTEELVIGWVKDKLGEEAITNLEAGLQAQIDEQRNPTKAIGLPW